MSVSLEVLSPLGIVFPFELVNLSSGTERTISSCRSRIPLGTAFSEPQKRLRLYPFQSLLIF